MPINADELDLDAPCTVCSKLRMVLYELSLPGVNEVRTKIGNEEAEFTRGDVRQVRVLISENAQFCKKPSGCVNRIKRRAISVGFK